MSPTKTTIPTKGTRVVYTSKTSFDIVESRLRASIQKDSFFSYSKGWPERMREVATSSDPKKAFISVVEETIGPHSFMHFTEFDHGSWLPIFDCPTIKTGDGRNLKTKRFILGNPLIALTMLRWDLDVGLFVPVELLLVEEEDGGCRIVYLEPSGLIAGFEGVGEELREAAEVLDGKLEGLVVDILRE